MGRIGDALLLVEAVGERRVVSKAGAVLARGHTRWRAGAIGKAHGQPLAAYRIVLHEQLAVIPYHICSARTVVHTIFHDTARPSHLLLPMLPADA